MSTVDQVSDPNDIETNFGAAIGIKMGRVERLLLERVCELDI